MSKPYTAEQLEAGVHKALEARDVEAAVDILTVLCTVDAERGRKLYDDIKFALGFAERFKP